MKNNFNSKAVKLGGYSIIVTAVVIAIVIILNLAINLLPSRFVKYSTSSQGLYDISDKSREVMKGVKDKITINIVSETDYVDEMVAEYVARYSDLNDRVSYTHIDPAIRPGFISQYTDAALSSQLTHLILVNYTNGRSRIIEYSDIYYKQFTDEQVYYYYMYYGQTLENPTYYNIEQELTSAIDYLTTEKLPNVYFTSGHGEITLDSTLSMLIDNENIKLTELKLVSEEKIPDDADVVIINAATKDFTSEEISTLQAYMDKGGNVILTSYYNTGLENRKLENLYGFAEKMGLVYDDVYVLEGSADRYTSGNPTNILPTVADSIYTSSIDSKTNLIMYACNGIKFSENLTSDITLKELFTTTVKGYAKTEINDKTTVEKAEGDIEGKHIIGAVSEKKNGEATSKLFWFASPAILDAQNAGSYSNISFFLSLLTNLCEKEASVTIDAKALQIEALTVSEASANLWGIILIGIIHVLTLAFGFVIWNRRVKR